MVKKRGYLLDANVRVYKAIPNYQLYICMSCYCRLKKARSCLQQCGVDFDTKIMDFTSERA